MRGAHAGRMKNVIAGFACLLVAGCASLSSAECGADAYALGQRDGRLGASPQAELYAQRCGIAPDRAQYDAGWRAGYSQRPIPLW
jgi:hypothetical protein